MDSTIAICIYGKKIESSKDYLEYVKRTLQLLLALKQGNIINEINSIRKSILNSSHASPTRYSDTKALDEALWTCLQASKHLEKMRKLKEKCPVIVEEKDLCSKLRRLILNSKTS